MTAFSHFLLVLYLLAILILAGLPYGWLFPNRLLRGHPLYTRAAALLLLISEGLWLAHLPGRVVFGAFFVSSIALFVTIALRDTL